MKVVVCVKQTPSTEAVFSIDGSTVTWEDNGGKPNVVNPWDEFAIEMGIQLKENHSADTVALSLGDDSVEEQLKMALAMGCAEAVRVDNSGTEGTGSHGTANILAAAVNHIGDVQIVVCGKQAIDGDSGLTPVLMAKALGATPLTYVGAINEVTDSTITVERILEDGRQVVQANLPVVISAAKEIGDPRYPSFMGIRKAGKATIPVVALGDLSVAGGVGSAKVDYSNIYQEEVVETETEFISGSPAEIATQIADKLQAEKVL